MFASKLNPSSRGNKHFVVYSKNTQAYTKGCSAVKYTTLFPDVAGEHEIYANNVCKMEAV